MGNGYGSAMRKSVMPRNIVLCCDGTANEFTVNRTNVVKLYYALALDDPHRQIAYYHPGLGTMEPSGALTDIGRRTTMLLGKVFGYGLSADIRDAYVYLMNRFETGDRVFLFGFSRGAYTARAVASLLRMYGLLARGNEPLVSYAIRMLCAVNKLDERTRSDGKRARKAQTARNEYFRLASAATSRGWTRTAPNWASSCRSSGRQDCLPPHFSVERTAGT